MKQILSILTLIVGVLGTTSLLSGQEVAVYASLIESTTNGGDLDEQAYDFLEEGVITYGNGNWVAVKLEVPSKIANEDHFIHLNYSLLDTLEMWMPDENNTLIRVYQTGQAFPFNTRPYASSDFVFPMIEGVQVYYFRAYTPKPIVLPVHVHNKEELIENLTKKDFAFGIYAGVMIVMFLYNLVLSFITRDRSYAFYIIFILSIALAQGALFGFTDRYLMPNWPLLNMKYTVFSGAFVGITTVYFIISFLQLKEKAPQYIKFLYLIVVLDIVSISFLFIGWDVAAFHIANFASTYGCAVVIVASIKLSRSGFKPAKFLLIAWTILITSVFIFALTNLGVLPYRPYFFGAMLFGSGIEVVLLSVALADRINILKKEREASKIHALEMAQENERIIREQNIILEEKVQSRTEELQSANYELQITLDNLKAAQTQLVQSEKMASLGVLTAGVAHEINNPLNYIHGGYTAISDEMDKDASDMDRSGIQEYLQWIRTGVERAAQIVKSLNIYSRSNDDYTENCNLNEIIEGCLSILQYKIKGHIEIEKDFADDLDEVKGNTGKLHQVFLNLIGNAIDAFDDEGVIKIKTENTKDYAVVRVEDNGCGIEKEDLQKIMDPFFTTKSPDEGTGLGLSIAYAIVEEHNGTINIESTKGEGTTVTVRLPKG